jgi:hypothetical protein
VTADDRHGVANFNGKFLTAPGTHTLKATDGVDAPMGSRSFTIALAALKKRAARR